MKSTFALSALLATVGLVSAQTLNIPSRVGSINTSKTAIPISGVRDFGNAEWDRGIDCTSDDDTGSSSAVFVLENGATLSNVIIGARSLEGVHCKGSCTLKNVWFRDVCEDAITILTGANGNYLIQGGGAQAAKDKVIQHNGLGTVTVKDYTVVTAGKLARSCGNCSNNKGPRKFVFSNIKAKSVSQLVGINTNFKDTAVVSGSCGTGVSSVCGTYTGVQKSQGIESPKNTDKGFCTGQTSLAAC